MRHLLVSGGPGHDFCGSAAVLIEVVGSLGATTTVLDDPLAAVAELRSAQRGDGPQWDLLTIHALRWSMGAERYAADRAQWAMTLGEDDLAAIEQHVAGGGGLLALHTAVICFDGHPRWHDLLGATWDWDRSRHGPLGPVEVDRTDAGRQHPITIATDDFTVVDELYERLRIDHDVDALLTGTQGSGTHPALWARHHGRGRVVTSLLGHGPDSLGHPSHRRLVADAAAWAARTPTAEGGSLP